MMKLRDLFLEAKPAPKKKTAKKPQGKLDFDSMSDKDFDAYMQNKDKAPEKAATPKASPAKPAAKTKKKSSGKKASKPKASSMPDLADLGTNAATGKEEPNYGDMSDVDFDSMMGKIGTSDDEMDNIAKKSGHYFGSDSDIDMGKSSPEPEEVDDDNILPTPPPLPKSKPKPPPLPNKPIPSLSQLAKGASDESDAADAALWSKFGQEDPNKDPALKGLPNFQDEPEENPFGEPPLPDVRTTAQKGVDALKKGGQSAFSKAMSSVGKAGSLVKQKAGSIFNQDPEPSVAYATAPTDTGTDSDWSKEDDAEMPTLNRLAQQTNTNTSNSLDKVGKKPQGFLAAGQDPKWRVGQTVDWRGQKDFKVIKAEKGRYSLQKIENGEIKTYKFIPGGNGLMPTATPPGSEKNFPGFKKGV